jgi:hypothetical protein
VQLFRQLSIPFDLIKIDLILQARLTRFLYNNYQSVFNDSPHWSLIQLIKPFSGILLENQRLIIFQPILFEINLHDKQIHHPDFLYLPLHQLKYEENTSIHIGYDQFTPTTISIPLKWLSKTDLSDYQISSKVCLFHCFARERRQLLLFSGY